MIPASQYFSSGKTSALELTEEEKALVEKMRVGAMLTSWTKHVSEYSDFCVHVSTGRVAEHSD